MPTYVEVPGLGEIEFPDSMSPAQIEEALRSMSPQAQAAPPAALPPNIQQQAAQMAIEGLPWYERALIGAGRGALETWEGARQLVGMGSPENQAMLDVPMPEDWATTGGYIGGEIAQLAAPLGLLPKMGRAATAAADVALSAGQAGLKAPTEDRSRLENAAWGAGGALFGQGLAQGIGAAIRPPLGQAAQQMTAQGIPLTPGQAHGGWRQAIESRLEAVPFVGSAVRGAQRRAIDAWNKDVLASVSPTGAVKDIGRKGIAELADQFDTAYRQLGEGISIPFNAADPANPFGQALDSVYRGSLPLLDNNQAQALAREIAGIKGRFDGKAVTLDGLTPVKNDLRSLGQAAMREGNFRLSQAYDALADQVDTALLAGTGNADLLAAKAALDRKYSEFKILQNAAGKLGAEYGVFTPRQAFSALKAEDKSLGKAATARGTRPAQEVIEQAMDIFGKDLPSPGPGSAEKTLFGIGAMVEPFSTFVGAPATAMSMRPTRPFLVDQGLPTIGVSSQLGEAAFQAMEPTKPTAAGLLAPIIPPELAAPLANEPFFQKWLHSPVKESANTVGSHRTRLALLSKGQQLTKEQRQALRQIQQFLQSLSE